MQSINSQLIPNSSTSKFLIMASFCGPEPQTVQRGTFQRCLFAQFVVQKPKVLSKKLLKGPWVFSLRERGFVKKTNDPWSLDELNLASTQDIVEMHCKDDMIDSHDDWVSFYDDMV